jgi:hypothetical protein
MADVHVLSELENLSRGTGISCLAPYSRDTVPLRDFYGLQYAYTFKHEYVSVIYIIINVGTPQNSGF